VDAVSFPALNRTLRFWSTVISQLESISLNFGFVVSHALWCALPPRSPW
jgi:hypothetical protein